jgi:lipoate-protein ligase B
MTLLPTEIKTQVWESYSKIEVPLNRSLFSYLICFLTLGHIFPHLNYNKCTNGTSGVWVNGNKIAAVGISASRWITTHGFAINISPDIATYFDPSIIIPCGISHKGVTSMEQELKIPICIHDVAQKVQICFESVFHVPLKPGDDLQ